MVQRFIGFVAVLAFAALANAAFAQDQALWSSSNGGDMSSIRYGSLSTTELPPFMLSCFNSMGIAVLDLHDNFGKIPVGQTLPVELSAGSAKVTLTGTVSRDASTGKVYAEVSDLKIKPVLQVLQSEGPITLKEGDASATLSDAGRATALKDFQDHCEID
jgi:hypothetical protein